MATQKQLAARALFAKRAKSGFFHRARRVRRSVRARFSRRRSLGGERVTARRRMRSSYRRFRSRFHRPHKQGIASKAINAVALAIGLEDVIFRFQEQGWVGNVQASLNNLSADYSFELALGKFDLQSGLRAYGPLVGAYAFKKGMSFLMRHIKIKL